MSAYIVRRLLWSIVVLLLLMLITFLLFNVLPTTDIARVKAGRQATEGQVEVIRQQLGLDQPVLKQFLDYLGDLFLRFDFQESYVLNEEVRTLIFQALPNTLVLIAGAGTIWLTVGVLIGTISAVRRGGVLDRTLMTGSLVLISAPVYFLGLIALYLFSSDLGVLGILPGAGSYDVNNGVFTNLDGMILPWLVLASAFSAIYARLTRSSLLETMTEDYIRTARAKGLPEQQVVVRHGLRSAITPIVTVFGLDLGLLVGSAILTETVFSIPGLGRLFFGAIGRNDVPVVQGATIFIALAVLVSNIVVDIVYAYIDPRVRYV